MISRIVIVAVLLLVGVSTAVGSESPLLNPIDYHFFAAQSPTQFAQADEEWGTSKKTAALPDTSASYKSPGRAVLYSLLLPGFGEVYVGESRTRAAIFFTAEVGFWSTFFYSRQLSSWRKNDYMQFAIANAGVDPDGKDEHFWDMIGFHNSRDDYNKISRVYSRDNPFFPETPAWDWRWETVSMRETYRSLKNDSESYKRIGNFALAGLALNRAVAMFYAWRSAKGHNRSVVDEFSKVNFRVLPLPHNSSVEYRVEYTRSF